MSNMLSFYMKIVIDTSVWISALISKESKSRDIFRLVFQDRLSPQMSGTSLKSMRCYEKRYYSNLTLLQKRNQDILFDGYLSTC